MSALKALWKFNPNKKHRNNKSSGSVSLPLERSSSNQQIKQFNTNTETPLEFSQFRRRAQTFSAPTVSKPQGKRRLSNADRDKVPRQKSEEICDEIIPYLEDMQLTLTSPRHYLRRRALVQDELQEDVNSSSIIRSANGYTDPSVEGNSNFFTIHLQVEGHNIKEAIETRTSHSVLDQLEYLLLKKDIDLQKSITEYAVVSSPSTSPLSHPVPVSLDKPSSDYAGHVVTIKNKDIAQVPQKPRKSSCKEATREEEKPRVFHSVQDCLDYFDEHGLVELPVLSEEESYQLPRVTPLEPIVREWEELPIDPQARNCLTNEAMEQQRAIWELIYKEYSHLKTLETIINVFMRCLELIHRAKVFTEDNYHNIFGYMEDLYHAHDQLWTYTLEPCLTKTYETKLPLDLNEILNRFPESFGQHFEIYEEHCTLDSLNISALQKASTNAEFNAYLNWCESRSECNRQKLKEMLAKPMQQLTRYHLLIKAIAKKTTNREQKERLEKIGEEVTSFVHVVDNGLRMQEETERVRDAMARITAYSVGDVPQEVKELVQSYTHLDLLAPMPDVEVDKPRLLMVEGSLHYRDGVKPKMSAVYVFLFTDMLLITKAIRKSSADKYKVIHAPHKITSLVVHSLTSESLFFLVLNEYNVLSSWFILKASSATVAEEWRKQVTAAQQFYQDAMSKKAQTWKLMENLRSERILNGIENLDSLSASLSQSLWSISSLSNKKSDCDLSQRSSTPSLQQHQQLSALSMTPSSDYSTKTVGARMKRAKYKQFRSQTASMDLSNSLALYRTTSLGGIYQGNQGKPSIGKQNGGLTNSQLLEHCRSTHMVNGSRGSGGSSHGYMPTHDPVHDRGVQRSPVSDISSTEGGEVYLWDESVRNGKGMRNGYTSSQKSATLPRQSRPRYSSLPVSKSSSHSPVNLNESVHFDDSNTSLNSQSLPDSSSNPLHSLLRVLPRSRADVKNLPLSRTRSHGEVEETKHRDHLLTPSPTPSLNIPSSHSQPVVGEEKLINPPIRSIRKKCNSVGSLDAPDINQLLQPSNKKGYRNSMPCSMEPSRRLSDSAVRSLSSSEGCLLKPSSSDSYFNVLYVRDGRDGYCRSQKPNVATVDEEEEGTTKIKNESLEEGEEADVSMASSSCTEVPLQKSSEELDTDTEYVESSDDAGAENGKNKKSGKYSSERSGKYSPGSNADSGVEESTDSERTQFVDVDKTPTRKSSVPVLELFPESVDNITCQKEPDQANYQSVKNLDPKSTNELTEANWVEQAWSLVSGNKSGGLDNSDGQGTQTQDGGKVLEDQSKSVSSNMELQTSQESVKAVNTDRNLLNSPRSKNTSPEKSDRCVESSEQDSRQGNHNYVEDIPTDKSKFLFIIPEMAVSDVDSTEPEAMTPLTKARYFFKEMKEMSSLSETDSDLDDFTPKDKFTLLHGWRNYKSISVESDDNYSPNSTDEQRFNVAVETKGIKASETTTTSQDSGERLKKESISLQTPAKKKATIPNLELPPSTSGSSVGVDGPVSQVDKYAAYSPLMRRKQHIPTTTTNTDEGNKLRRPQSGGELNSKSKVKELSQMFEVKQQTNDVSSGKGCQVSKTDAVKKGTHRIRTKTESGGVETIRTRKESVSRIPVAGDKKKYKSVQSRKENFNKSPEPVISADKLLPPKPAFRSRHVQPADRRVKHGQVAESANKYTRPISRASSAPQPKLKTKPSTTQEPASIVKQEEDHNGKSHGPRPSTAEILLNSEDFGEDQKTNLIGKAAAAVVRKTSSTEESKPRQTSCKEAKVKCSGQDLKSSSVLPEPKLKPSTSYRNIESKSKTSNSQVCKPSPTRTREPRTKTSALPEPTKKLSNAPEPKPKPRNGVRSRAVNPHWELLGSRTRPGAKFPATSASLQRLNGSRSYYRQSSTSSSTKEAAEVHPITNDIGINNEENRNSLASANCTTQQ